MPETVLLEGGPLNGKRVPRPTDRSLLIELFPDNPGMVARYRMSRDRDVFRFKGWDRVVARIPLASDDKEQEN